MKTPNEPESTACAGAGFSFLSDFARAVSDRARMKARTSRFAVANFTRFLLLRPGSQYPSDRASWKSRPRSHVPNVCPSGSLWTPAYSFSAARHTACETARDCGAEDVPFLFHRPALSNAARVPRLPRPERLSARQTSSAEPRFGVERTPRHPEQ